VFSVVDDDFNSNTDRYRLMCLLIHVDVLTYLSATISCSDFDMRNQQ